MVVKIDRFWQNSHMTKDFLRVVKIDRFWQNSHMTKDF